MAPAVLTVYNCAYVPPESPRSRLDGDTFRCQGKVEPIIPDSQLWVPKVRLIRINAPETGQPGAEEARQALIDWLIRKPFNLICYARDKYGRLLADAEAGEGLLSQYMLDHDFVVPMGIEMAKSLLLNPAPELVLTIAHAPETA
jgi:hypothetical protein